jgi:hypothetical protein
MKYLTVSFLFITFLVFSSAAQAQDLSVDLRLFDTQARVFYVGNLDPAGMGNAPNYFQVEIRNDGETEQHVRLKFSVLGNNIAFVEGETEAFRLPGHRVYPFNNNQLNTGVMIDGQEIRLVDYQVYLTRIADLENKVGATGKLPAGTYEFRVELSAEPPSNFQTILDTNPGDNILTISNPTTIEPISPGNQVNSGDVPEIPTTTPYFIWQSDAGLFNLLVYRKYEAEDIQDVLSRDPILRLVNYPNQVFQYPSETSPVLFPPTDYGDLSGSQGAVRLIEPGYIYYWYVEALIPSASGWITLPSDVYQFKVADRERAAANRNQILVYLRQILGQKYDQYMSQLQGYDPSGNLLISSAPIDIQDLEEFVRKLVTGKITIQEVIIEN